MLYVITSTFSPHGVLKSINNCFKNAYCLRGNPMRSEDVTYADYANLTETQIHTLRSLGIRTDYLGGSINLAEIINIFSKKMTSMQSEINALKDIAKEVAALKEAFKKDADK